MPLYKKIIHNEQTQILVWQIAETLDELLSGIVLTEASKNRWENMRSETHKKGFLSVRHLLKMMNYSDADLFYTSNGKPNLRDGKHISITHSFDFSAIIVSDFVVGIDIERNREKILKIAPKFIGKENEYLDQNNEVEMLTVIWGAKESLFKIHPDGGLLFKEHLPIDAFRLSDQKTKGWIIKDNPDNKSVKCYSVYFGCFEGYTLVYVVN